VNAAAKHAAAVLAQAWADHRAGRTAQAVARLDAALALQPVQAEWCMQRGLWCAELGRRAEAGASLALAVQQAPDWGDAWHNLGLFRLQDEQGQGLEQGPGQGQSAADALQQAVRLSPGRPASLRALGLAFARLGRPAAALQCQDRALEHTPDDDVAAAAAILADRAALLSTLDRLDEALHSTQRARQLSPGHVPAWTNEAAVLLRLHRPAEALAAAAQALQRAPGDAAAWANRIRALHLLQREDEALREAQALTHARPDAAAAWNLRLGLCTLARRWSEAAEAAEHVLRLAPTTPFAAGRWLHARGQLCRWEGWTALLQQHAQAIAAGQTVAVPFGLLALLDDGDLQRQAVQQWLQQELPLWPWPVAGALAAAPPAARAHSRRPGPWRVGWFSADFRSHALSRLLVGSFEAMDQRNFEHHALSITPVCGDDLLQQRLRAALPRWHELRVLDDERAAQTIAALELDVLVDLTGPARGARPGVLARRPAPWQVAYLGFMACSSTPAPRAVVDALVADDTTVPAAHAADFGERVLRMPAGLWPRESVPMRSPVLPTMHRVDGDEPTAQLLADPHPRQRLRQAQGLPTTGFVFCNFCDAAKLNPPLFDVWMRLLLAVPDSVLWLRRSSQEMATNLQAEAAQRGVAPQRLVWAERLPWVQHLARHAAADLFVDSWPLNGHTTVADALLAGLPVLTLQGRAMAARVAASQLHSLGLDDLICSDVPAYEALAVALARQPQRLAGLCQRLRAAQHWQTGPAAVRRHADELLALLVGAQGSQGSQGSTR
jgi:predicted O-linked N-acetylglucosamine transferase (SPINDLY family)